MNQTDFTKQKRKDFYQTYREVWATNRNIRSRTDAVMAAINHPAPRFYVSSEEAYKEICRISRQQSFYVRSAIYQQMYRDIYDRCKPLIDKGISVKEAVDFVIEQQAPRFYITYSTALVQIHRHLETLKSKKQEEIVCK